MRILTLTYPLIPVTDDACGGTEQVAVTLLRHLSEDRRLELTWIGAPGSVLIRDVNFLSWPSLLVRCGELRPLQVPITPTALADLKRRCNRAVLAWLAKCPVALVHNQGAFFGEAAPAIGTPVLFSLHLACRLYPPGFLGAPPSNLHFQCVSASQQRAYGAGFATVPNGIDLARFPSRRRRLDSAAPLLYLGRICEEKAPHVAIAAARRAGRRLIIAGAIAPFPSHQDYFRRRIAPHLDADVVWLQPPSFRAKLALLHSAAAVVIPSQIEETSSLVAMEAAASGVPVIATRCGALPEIVADGETGWLADGPEELAEAVARITRIVPAVCRARAEKAFDARDMAAGYTALYGRLAMPGACAYAA